MTGFLNDLGLSKAPTDPNFMPEGQYPAVVYKLNVKDVPAKDTKPASKALIITYKIDPLDPEHQGKVKTEFKSLPTMDLQTGEYVDDESKKNASYLKLRLLSLGVPEDALDDMKQEDLLGTPVWIKIVQSGQFYNIREVKLREASYGGGQL